MEESLLQRLRRGLPPAPKSVAPYSAHPRPAAVAATWNYLTSPDELQTHLAAIKRDFVRQTGQHIDSPGVAAQVLEQFAPAAADPSTLNIPQQTYQEMLKHPEERKILIQQLLQTVLYGGRDVSKTAAVSTKQMIATERRKVEEPTEAQAEAGNYRKGHITLHGLDISIENAKGSTRSGTSPDGKEWSIVLKCEYGYIKRTEGADGDHVDCFIGPNPEDTAVFVVNQVDPGTRKFDEHKVLLGFSTKEKARKGYLANYEDGWQGLGSLKQMTMDEFKEWLDGDTTKRAARDDGDPRVSDVVRNEDSMLYPQRHQLPEVWGKGDHSLQKMAKFFPSLLPGYGSVPSKDNVGAGQQRRQLRAAQLPVGNSDGASAQSEKQSAVVVPWTADVSDCVGGGNEVEAGHGIYAVAKRMEHQRSADNIRGLLEKIAAGTAVPDVSRQDFVSLTVGEKAGAVATLSNTPVESRVVDPSSTDAVDAEERAENCDGVAQVKAAALGIPDRADMGDLAKLAPGLVDFVVQFHRARRSGPHFDVRIGTPGTGLFSWATRHALPEPGFRRALFRQPLHSHDYGSFEGNLPVGGYGAGQVKIHRKGQVLITKIKPGLVEFTTADKRHPERFKLLRPAGWKDDDWLLINTTPREGTPYDKVHYKKVDGTQVDSAIDKMRQGDSIEAKIDGASSLVKILEKGVEITSYRTSKEGRPITHTERVFHGRPELRSIPPEFIGTVLKGELYGQGPKGVIPAQELGGLLNAALAKSIGQQKERGIQLRNMVYDISQFGKQPLDVNQVPRAERRRMMEEVVKHLPAEVFGVSEAVEDPEKARQLWAQIQAGEHPLTSEGIVGHPAVGRPWKGKITEESDVHVTDVFPGEGRLAGEAAGGFGYALEPGGPAVGKVGTGLSDEVRRALWADPEAYIGRIAKIRAQEQFPSGAYRAPVFRSWHEDYPLATKEGEVQGLYCSAVDLQRFLPETDLSLDGGLQKRADKEEHPPIIAVDLDGTILEYDGWKGEDHFGDPRVGARKALKELQRRGYLVVINTCRGNTQAVKDVLHENDLPYDYVNFSPYQPPGTSDKIQADIYIDDRAVDARQPWSKITKETLRRIEAASKRNSNGKTKTANQGSFYLAAVPSTPITYNPDENAVQNLIRNLGHVRQRGDQAIREAYTQDALANAADPNRSIRRFSSYLAGTRKPIVHHWLDRIIQGGL